MYRVKYIKIFTYAYRLFTDYNYKLLVLECLCLYLLVQRFAVCIGCYLLCIPGATRTRQHYCGAAGGGGVPGTEGFCDCTSAAGTAASTASLPPVWRCSLPARGVRLSASCLAAAASCIAIRWRSRAICASRAADKACACNC